MRAPATTGGVMARLELRMTSTTARPSRDYGALLESLPHHSCLAPAHREPCMQALVDGLWPALGGRGVSWIGFYLKAPRADEMILGPRRDKPACSPIGLHGMCGRCWRERRPIIVRDVATLGANYI